MTSRDDKLEESMLSLSGQRFEPYTVGRTRMLKHLGNPFFGGDGDKDEWDNERRLGVAWVIFTTPWKEMGKWKDNLEGIDAHWEEHMHDGEVPRIFHYIQHESELEQAAHTEAVPEKTPGK